MNLPKTNSVHKPKVHSYRGNIHEGEYVSLPSRPLPISTSGTPGPETPNRIALPDLPFIHGPSSSNIGNNNSHLYDSEASRITPVRVVDETVTRAVSPSSALVIGPTLVHEWTHSHSILCVIAAPLKNLVICGTQDSKILLFDMNDYSLKHEIPCGSKDHSSSILCLTLSEDENYLFSGGSDSLVKVWDLSTTTNKPSSNALNEIHCTHIIYSLVDIGDIFSISWSSSLSTLFIGAQNASILWCTLCFDRKTDLGYSTSSDSISEEFINVSVSDSVEDVTPSSVGVHYKPLNANLERLPHFRYDKFFDSKGPGGSINYLQSKHQLHRESAKNSSKRTQQSLKPKLMEITNDDIIRFAHNGYVYCMEIFNCKEQSESNDFLTSYQDKYENLLISCGGDGIINFWGITSQQKSGKGETVISLENITSLDSQDSVLSMAIQDSYIYAGLSNSTINVWDLCTFQLIRSFKYCDDNYTGDDEESFDNDEILSLGIHNHCIFKASNKGGLSKLTLKLHSPKSAIFEEVRIGGKLGTRNDEGLFSQEDVGPVLAVRIFTTSTGITYLLSGCNKSLGLWDITKVGDPKDNTNTETECVGGDSASITSDASGFSEFENDTVSIKNKLLQATTKLDNNSLLKSLQRYISYKTISRYPALYVEDSRHCAQFLTKLLISFGAKQTRMLPVENGNPVVYAAFSRNCVDKTVETTTKRLLWYAHYDVVDAEDERDDWTTDPFTLTAKDGNLYARGVSDNKGPTLAAIYSVAELYSKNALTCDVVFIIEGEEECGSIGFQRVINANKSLIGNIDYIMLSNSYWLDDQIPCLNYGLRGVINASILIKSEKPDRHSGVDGGVLQEPTMSLVQILGTLIAPKTNKIQIPNFYDDVLPITEREIEIYKKIELSASNESVLIDQDLKTLLAKWRNPSLTVHKIEVSGPNNNTVIPQTAEASISIRVVPNQDLEKIKALLIKYLQDKFQELNPPAENQLSIDIFHEAEPWLGDPSNIVYQILYKKLVKNWGPETPEPLFIREGGSIPSIRFLEKCFNAPAAQIPCGQASDNAHLKDEKLRVLNLFKLRNVLYDTFKELGEISN